MSDNTCDKCQHWIDSDAWDIPPGFKKCAAAPMADEMTEWDHDLSSLRLKEEYSHVLMCAMDGSSYRADVYTAAKFYCPMFKANSEV